VQMGDATGDGYVLNADISYVNARVPCISGCDDDNRADMNGDNYVLNADVSIVYAHYPSFGVTKHSGH